MNLLVGEHQLWTLIIGALVPLVTYVLNYVGPWADEKIKAFVLVLASAAAGGLYTALESPNFGWNTQTRELVLSAVVAALAAHQWLWKPSTVSTALGGGRNANANASDGAQTKGMKWG